MLYSGLLHIARYTNMRLDYSNNKVIFKGKKMAAQPKSWNMALVRTSDT